MKKTLQINLAGISFTIEEDAYSKLSQYLKSIQQYFSSYESSEEIILDIETRIAEKFFVKTKTDSTQIIEMEDVNNIIKSMGNVSDFEAIEEEEDLSKSRQAPPEPEPQTTGTSGTASRPTKFYRDNRRKALGGVLAGFAHNFSIDVVWLRVLFIILAFGLIETGIGGFFFIAYIICWIAFPQRDDLEENEKIKKFYRNPDNKVISGVASGLSSYFGVDLSVVRLIFVVTGCFGVGILIYIILWVAAPSAFTLTQKMELKGQPVTLENIETNIKRSMNNNASKPESNITKLLLFPFRLIGIVLKGIGNILRNLGPAVRVLAGLVVLLLGASMLFASVLATLVFFGFTSDVFWFHDDNFFGMITKDFPQSGGFFAFLVTAIPAAAITIAGISLLTNQRQGTRNFWLTGLALWFTGLVGISAVGSKYAMNFSKKHKIEVVEKFSAPQSILFLDVKDQNDDDDDDDDDDDFRVRYNVSVELETGDSPDLVIRKYFHASGSSKKIASENAGKLSYNVTRKDSALYFSEYLNITGPKLFREQRGWIHLEIPRNKKFRMSRTFADRLLHNRWDLMRANGISHSDIEQFTFVMGDDNEIECLDCPKLTEEEKEALRHYDFNDAEVIDNEDFENHGSSNKLFDLKGFSRVDIGSAIRVFIKKGTNYHVEAFAHNEKDLEDLILRVKGNTLTAEFEDSFINHRDPVNIVITMPDLDEVDFSGAVKAKIIGFEENGKVKISLSGASKAAADIEAGSLDVSVSGASKLEVRGKTDYLNADVSGASKFLATKLSTDKARVTASGASKANLGKVSQLDSDTSGGSKISRE